MLPEKNEGPHPVNVSAYLGRYFGRVGTIGWTEQEDEGIHISLKAFLAANVCGGHSGTGAAAVRVEGHLDLGHDACCVRIW